MSLIFVFIILNQAYYYCLVYLHQETRRISPGGGGLEMKLTLTNRIHPGTRRTSHGLFTRRPGDFLLGGGLRIEVDIDKENISRYQENISWSNHRETRRFSPWGGAGE